MQVTCPHCREQMELQQPSAESVTCAKCGKSFSPDAEAAGDGKALLETYRQTKSSEQRGGLRRRGRALRLKKEVKDLRLALENQYSRLGERVLEHPPEGLDISAETGALQRIQTELQEKQAALDSLRASKGGRQVVKNLQREIRNLQREQDVQMATIGRKAFDSGAEVENALGETKSIELLRQQLAPKQAELEGLEQELGPLPEPSKLGRKAGVGAAVVVAVIVVLIVVSLALRGPSGWDYQPYLPRDTFAVVRIDVGKAMEDERLKPLGYKLDEELSEIVAVSLKDVEEIVIVWTESNGDDPIVLVRTKEDLSLREIFRRDYDIEREHGFDYAKSGGRYDRICAAKLDVRVFCLADRDRHLVPALGAIDTEEVNITDGLRNLIAETDHYDVYVAADVRTLPHGYDKLPFETVSSGASLGERIPFETRVKLRENEEADEVRDMLVRSKKNVGALRKLSWVRKLDLTLEDDVFVTKGELEFKGMENIRSEREMEEYVEGIGEEMLLALEGGAVGSSGRDDSVLLKIHRNPEEWAGREVEVRGKVVRVLDWGYVINDGHGEMAVIPARRMPVRSGSKTTVTATVKTNHEYSYGRRQKVTIPVVLVE